MTTADGETWSKIRPVMMLNGKPMNAIIEQDLHVLPSGRIVGAAHFMPNLVASCIYSDSPLGINGWVKGHLSEGEKPSFATSNAIEPSLFRQKDGTLVMVFRDQNSSFRKLASVSHDEGEHWTKPALTVFPDSRSKQSAGNLPDGTAYFVSNPVGYKQRVPLVLSLSRDTRHFNRAFVLRRGGSQLPPRRYEGRYKTIGYSYPKTIISGGFIMTSYSTNKEDIEITRVPLSSLKE
jgi:predicted neuraminidase